MDPLVESSELLLEIDILSLEEKEEILEKIDRDLAQFYHRSINDNTFSAHSSGLTTPFLIVIAVLILSVLVILNFNATFLDSQEYSQIETNTEFPQTEWGILNFYMKESTEKLEMNEVEIKQYKAEISEYNRRLNTLRKLLDAKEQVENRLSIERVRLTAIGQTDDIIETRVNDLEDSLIGKLSPELVAFYDTGIDEINEEIQQLLYEKNISEASLEQSLVEKEILNTEAEIIKEAIILNSNEDLQVLDIIDKVNKFSDISVLYEREKQLNSDMTVLYSDIFENMLEGKTEIAREKFQKLEELIPEENFKNLDNLIDEKTVEVSFTTLEKQILPENSNKSLDPSLLGVISFLDFDNVIIKSFSNVEIRIGMVFSIYKKTDSSLSSLLAKGKISDFSEELIFGKIESIFNLDNRLETNDLVYLDIRENQ